MIFKRFYNEPLAQASYLVGCAVTGEAIVIDPIRDPDLYVKAAQAEKLRISAVTETHIHADYLSGTRELSALTGAQMYLSDEGTADWKYAFANDPNVTLVKDGSVIRIGNIRLDVVATPGHTPEHVTFVLTDEPASDQPLGAFTGDFIFVGDVGRPDLLERAANIKGTMEVGGRQLFASLQKFSNRPDGLLVWPGHGAGSACGKNLGGAPVSSLGYEKASNWAFRYGGETEFVEEVLAGQPEPPKYFAMMKKLNKQGPNVIGKFVAPTRLDGAIISGLLDRGAQIIDLRTPEEAAKGYIPGTINIEQDKYLANWAGWFMNYTHDIYCIASTQEQANRAKQDLALIGLDNVRGWFDLSVFAAFQAKGAPLATIEDADYDHLDETVVLDVRGTKELASGTIPGSIHIPLGYLPDMFKELPQGKKIAVHCSGGYRSPIAVTVLVRLGMGNVCNVPGGFDEYKRRGLPIQVGGKEPLATAP